MRRWLWKLLLSAAMWLGLLHHLLHRQQAHHALLVALLVHRSREGRRLQLLTAMQPQLQWPSLNLHQTGCLQEQLAQRQAAPHLLVPPLAVQAHLLQSQATHY